MNISNKGAYAQGQFEVSSACYDPSKWPENMMYSLTLGYTLLYGHLVVCYGFVEMLLFGVNGLRCLYLGVLTLFVSACNLFIMVVIITWPEKFDFVLVSEHDVIGILT